MPVHESFDQKLQHTLCQKNIRKKLTLAVRTKPSLSSTICHVSGETYTKKIYSWRFNGSALTDSALTKNNISPITSRKTVLSGRQGDYQTGCPTGHATVAKVYRLILHAILFFKFKLQLLMKRKCFCKGDNNLRLY